MVICRPSRPPIKTARAIYKVAIMKYFIAFSALVDSAHINSIKIPDATVNGGFL